MTVYILYQSTEDEAWVNGVYATLEDAQTAAQTVYEDYPLTWQSEDEGLWWVRATDLTIVVRTVGAAAIKAPWL